MLHVWKASGEELAVVKLEDFREVRDLKRHLQGLCGLPRFRQRLVSKSLGILGLNRKKLNASYCNKQSHGYLLQIPIMVT